MEKTATMEVIIDVRPNPFISELTVRIFIDTTVIAIIRLTNEKGIIAKMMSCTLEKGETTITLNKLSKFAAGNYNLEVRLLNGDEIKRIPLVKK
jgi:hypothetical protein